MVGFVLRLFTGLCASAFAVSASAQCAMCKATAESATDGGRGVGEGLNSGIMYLMGIPYLLLVTVALVFFRKRIWAFFKT